MANETPTLHHRVDDDVHAEVADSGADRGSAADPALSAVPSAAVHGERISRFAAVLARSGLDAAVIGSGADLQYLVGHSVASHERLTALAVAADGTAALLVPILERPGWDGTPTEELDLQIVTWSDGDDQHTALAALLPETARVLAVDYYLPAMHALGIQAAVPGSELRLAA